MKQLHNTQLKILNKLLFHPKVRYTDLKPTRKMDNNKFTFHLDQLLNLGHVQKFTDGYSLTKTGKEYANRMDTDKSKIMKQSKIGVFVCPIREKNGKRELLICTRLKHPFYGCQGFMGGKISYGEKITEGARRELKEETNLDGEIEIVSIRHFLVTDKNTQELLEDKIVFLCRTLNPTGELKSNNEGKFEWILESEIFDYITKPFETIDSLREQIEQYINFDGTMIFHEQVHVSENF